MKQLLIPILLFISFLGYSQTVSVGDTDFEKYLEYINLGDGDIGNLQVSASVADVINLHIPYSIHTSKGEEILEIQNLDGIENFTSLETLYCENQQLTDLDVSMLSNLQVLDVSNNNLESLDVNGLTNLTTLECSNNQLQSLDISDLSNLRSLYCSWNNLQSLTTDNHPNFTSLSCYNNDLTRLDLSSISSLEHLYCGNNDLLTYLNLKNNNSLNYMNAENNADLYCIEVDDPVAANSQGNWYKDSQAAYNTECDTDNSLYFDGQDQITIPHDSRYDLGYGDFTVEAWIKADANQIDIPRILSHRSQVSGKDGFVFGLKFDGKLMIQLDGLTYTSTSSSLFDNTCHHLAVTRNSGLVTFYVDGVSIGTVATNKSIDTDNPHEMFIGNDDITNTEGFTGEINDVRFWNVSRTATDIATYKDQTLIGTESGLIGNWNFDSDNGQTATDNSALLNDGVYGITTSSEAEDPSLISAVCATTAKLSNARSSIASETQLSINRTLKLYPNSTSTGVFTLETTGLLAEKTVKVIDFSGKVVYKTNLTSDQLKIDLSNYSGGIYSVIVSDGINQQVEKIVVE